MKPRPANISDLIEPENKTAPKNELTNNGSTKAALLVTVTLLFASNIGWMLYLANRQKKMNELLLTRKEEPDAAKVA